MKEKYRYFVKSIIFELDNKKYYVYFLGGGCRKIHKVEICTGKPDSNTAYPANTKIAFTSPNIFRQIQGEINALMWRVLRKISKKQSYTEQ